MAWYNFWKSEKRNNTEQTSAYSPYSGLGLEALFNPYVMPAITLSAVFAAVELISNSVAELPIAVKTKKDNKSSIVNQHPIYNIFNNSLLTKYMLVKMMVTDMLLYGDGFAYIKRASDGTPIELIYCPHGTVSIQYNEQRQSLYYLAPSIIKGRIEPINMLHIIKNSKNGVEGKGVLEYANKTIQLASYTEKAAADYFSSGCHVAGILSTNSPRLTNEQRESIRTAWNQSHGKNGSGMAVLEAGMTYQAVSSNSRDSQLLETRLFNIQDIARFFNINPVLLGDLSHSSYSTIEASLLEFVTHTLFPYITLVEEEFTRKLIKPSEKDLYIDLDENFILKSDKTSQASYLSTLVSNGIMTPNEARQQLGFNAIEGGDKIMVAYSKVEDNTIGEQNDRTTTDDNGNMDS